MKTYIACPQCEHDMFHFKPVNEMEEYKIWSFRCKQCGRHLLIKTLIRSNEDALQTN